VLWCIREAIQLAQRLHMGFEVSALQAQKFKLLSALGYTTEYLSDALKTVEYTYQQRVAEQPHETLFSSAW
jgi:hypothetical protein